MFSSVLQGRFELSRMSVHAKWIIGRVIGTKMYKTAKVRVTRLVLDPYLLKVNFEHHSLLMLQEGPVWMLHSLL